MSEATRRFFTRRKNINSDSNEVEITWDVIDIRVDEDPFGYERISSGELSLSASENTVIEEEIIDFSDEAFSLPDLPEVYEKDMLTILPRDPFSSFCYWEITEDTFSKFQSSYKSEISDNSQTVLRLYRLSEINNFTGEHCFEKVIDDLTLSGSIYLDYSATYNLFYASIGYKTYDNNFFKLITSSIPEKISEEYSYSWKTQISEESWFGIEVKDGVPVVKTIEPPPIPAPLISFDLLITDKISPDVITVLSEIDTGEQKEKQKVYRLSRTYSEKEENKVEKYENITDITTRYSMDNQKETYEFKRIYSDNLSIIPHMTSERVDFIPPEAFEEVIHIPPVKSEKIDMVDLMADIIPHVMSQGTHLINLIPDDIMLKHITGKFMEEKLIIDKEEINTLSIKDTSISMSFIMELIKERFSEELPFPFTGSPSS